MAAEQHLFVIAIGTSACCLGAKRFLIVDVNTGWSAVTALAPPRKATHQVFSQRISSFAPAISARIAASAQPSLHARTTRRKDKRLQDCPRLLQCPSFSVLCAMRA